MLDIEEIRQLIEMMVANDLAEVSVRNGSEEIKLRRSGPGPVSIAAPAAAGPVAAAPFAGTEGMPSLVPRPEPEDQLVEIASPMVGTFFAAADPESPPFVEVGSMVRAGTVVCILEAMKVFNEIKAEVAGIVERILVKNSQTVEYGQTLFMVRPI